LVNVNTIMRFETKYTKSNKVNHTLLKGHITHKSGRQKTVCVTACLTALGVNVNDFHYTGGIGDSTRENILRKHGYAVRSRMSLMGKNPTMGKVRKAIQKLKDSQSTKYLVIVYGRGYSHAILLNRSGNTIVDTAPKLRDKRKVFSIKAIFIN